jgi:hypothetical protein
MVEGKYLIAELHVGREVLDGRTTWWKESI